MKTTITTYSEKTATALCVSGDYLWVAFASDGTNCVLYKVSLFDNSQIFYDIDVAVDEITAMYADDDDLYITVDDDTYIGARYSLTNPLTDYEFIDIPVGAVEKGKDLIVDDTYIYMLTPGEESALEATILIFDISDCSFVESITLTGITDAYKIDLSYNSALVVLSVGANPILTKVTGSVGSWSVNSYNLT